jgi:DNA primase small subunit
MRISTSPQERNKIIYDLFKEYYRYAKLELPKDMELREFAFQPFNSEIYVRHLSFANEEELRQYILQNVPLHLYYSSARYQLPSAKEMEEKGWLGSDLLFDLDADEICKLRVRKFCDGIETFSDCQGIEYAELDNECVSLMLEKAFLIRDKLKEDFGLQARIFFSGNRGFHIRVECYGDCALLDSEDRREIAEYFISPPDFEGVKIDEQVTIDPKRLVRIPGSLNGKSGLRVMEVLGGFEFDESLSPFSGEVIFYSFVTSTLRALNEEIRLKKESAIKLPASIGIYLTLKGLGVIKAYVR